MSLKSGIRLKSNISIVLYDWRAVYNIQMIKISIHKYLKWSFVFLLSYEFTRYIKSTTTQCNQHYHLNFYKFTNKISKFRTFTCQVGNNLIMNFFFNIHWCFISGSYCKSRIYHSIDNVNTQAIVTIYFCLNLSLSRFKHNCIF